MLHLTRCTWHGAVVQMPIQSPYKLIVAAKDGTVVRTVDLAHRRTLTIGRSPRCDLTMDIESISRRHATMICLNNTWTLIDADSKSKFKVDNEKVDYATLSEERPILAPNRTKRSGPSIDRSISSNRKTVESLLNRDRERHSDRYGFGSPTNSHMCSGGRTHHCRVIPRCRLLSGYQRMVAGPVGIDPRAIRRGPFGCRFTTATASSREIMPPVGKSRINPSAMRGPPPAVGG